MAISDLIKGAKNIASNTGAILNNVMSSVGSSQAGDTGFGQGGDTGFSGVNDDNSSGYDDGWWYGGYGGYGGGKSAADIQEETQTQINNTAANYGQRGKDLSDLSKQNLGNIQSQIDQNQALYNQTRRQNMRQVEWQPNQQREQSTLSALRTRAGNGLYGSGLTDLMEGIGRVDDMNDVQLINTFKQNSNAAYDNWFQANEDLVSDYIDQMTAIQDEFSKLYSQYWSTMSNINPLLATEENMRKAAGGESASIGEGTDAYTLPAGTSIKPSDELQALLKAPERASAVNPYTRDFIRPDRAVTAARAIPNTGSANRSTAANQGYLDNLDIYQRRV